MLIIINDDPVYTAWLARHRQGFVVDSKRKPTRGHLVLHRATCSIIKPHKRARLTTGAHLKACSLECAELIEWAEEQTGTKPTPCEQCQPYSEEQDTAAHDGGRAMTHLGREMLSYILDVAVMYLDGEEPRFRATLQNVAEYLDKTPRQLAPVLRRLMDEGFAECDVPLQGDPAAHHSVVYPTGKALRSIPAFEAMASEDLKRELAKLKTGD